MTFCEPGTTAKAIQHLSPADKTGLLGYLGKHQLGFVDEITDSAHRKYGVIARQLGLVPGLPLEAMGAANQVADIFSGRVIDLQS